MEKEQIIKEIERTSADFNQTVNGGTFADYNIELKMENE
jgi:hypothetical protein